MGKNIVELQIQGEKYNGGHGLISLEVIMQEEILKIILNNKELPQWILQSELIELVLKELERTNECCVKKALASLRDWEEIPFQKIIHESQLKKLGRNDLIKTYHVRHFTFAYKIR